MLSKTATRVTLAASAFQILFNNRNICIRAHHHAGIRFPNNENTHNIHMHARIHDAV